MAVTRNPFNARLSWKWLVAIGILAIAISLVIGIILGVIAVHFSNATVQSAASTASEDRGAANALESHDVLKTNASNANDTQPQRIVAASETTVQLPVIPDGPKATSASPANQPQVAKDDVTSATQTFELSSEAITEEMLLDAQVNTNSPIPSTGSHDAHDTSATSVLPDTESSVANDVFTQSQATSTKTVPVKLESDAKNSTPESVNSSNEELRIRPATETISESWTAYANGSGLEVMNERPAWLNVSTDKGTISSSSSSTPLNATSTTLAVTTIISEPASTRDVTSPSGFSTEQTTEELPHAHAPDVPGDQITPSETALESSAKDSTVGVVHFSTLAPPSIFSSITDAQNIIDIQSNETDEVYRNILDSPKDETNITEAAAVSTTNISSPNSTDIPSTTEALVVSNSVITEPEETSEKTSVTSTMDGQDQNVSNYSSGVNSNEAHEPSSLIGNNHSTNDPTGPVRQTHVDEDVVDIDLGELQNSCPDAPHVKIFSYQFCDEKVDCPGATDEKHCSCLERMKNRYPTRICDGVPDCPSMEDELGCHGCNETQFTCELRRQRAICLPLRQRCDGVEHCPDGMDEAGCSRLAPIEKHAELSQISIPMYGTGYVFRNIQNKWYPLCAPPPDTDVSVLAHSICRMTVGETTDKPKVSRVNAKSTSYDGVFAKADPTRRRPYMVTFKCPTSELLSVSCPLPRCGKKAPSIQEAMKSAFNSVKLAKSFEIGFNSDEEVTGTLSSPLRPPLIKPGRRKRSALHRIVGGVFSKQGSWPSMVAILKDGNFTCGGTLIRDGSWILSAAHCFESLQMYHFEAQLGMLRTTSFSPLEQTRVIRNIYIHPGYNRITLEDDIALLEVDTPFDLSQWAAPSCLSQAPFLSANKTQCIVIGWGDTFEGGPESDELREVTVPLTDCTVETTVKRSKVLCAGYPDGLKDACQGDSGGPLMCPDPDAPGSWTLAGVVSSGIGCARPGLAGVYTRISYYLGWINATIEGKEEPLRKPRHNCPGITCLKGVGQCVSKRLQCDHRVHCFNAEDESDCHTNLTTEAPATTPTTVTSGHEMITIPITFRPPVPSICSDREFMCFRELQCIDVSRRCNFIKDCTDGTDELNCTCADYLVGLGKKELICDDNVDCKDSSDELGCRVCAAGEYFSFVSSECIPVRKMCDGSPDALLGDDESGCVALSSSSNRLELDYKARAKYSTNGTVFINSGGRWQPLCASESSMNTGKDFCATMGFPKTNSLLLTSDGDEESRQFLVEAPSNGFLWTSPPSRWVAAKVATSDACQTVNVACEKYQCGTRPAFTSSGGLEGNAPWHATLFANGKYLCGATLVHEKWIVASDSCFENVNWSQDYVEALMGSHRFLPFTSPNEQVRRISGYTAVPTNEKLVLLRLEHAFVVNQFVNPACMPESLRGMRQLLKRDQCLAVGLNGTLLSSPSSVSVKLDGLRSLSVLWHNNETFECFSEKLVGGLSCSDGNQWYFVALFEKSCETQGSLSNVLTGVWRQSSIISDIIACDESHGFQTSRKRRQSICSVPIQNIEPPSCTAMRCPLGGCLSSEQVCDGIPNCRDFRDEANCCLDDQYRCPTGECIANHQLCDGIPDCPDGEDETNPRGNITCPTDVFRCMLKGESRSNITVRFEDVCNGVRECPNGADEALCSALSRNMPIEVDSNGNPKDYPNEGYMMVRISNTWYTLCDPDWDAESTSIACQYFGFNQTALFKKEYLRTEASCNFNIYVTCS